MRDPRPDPSPPEPVSSDALPGAGSARLVDTPGELDRAGAAPRTTEYAGRRGASANEHRGLQIFAAPGLHERVAELAVREFPPGAKVCDLGAGTGALGVRLEDRGFRVTAADLVADNFGAGDSVEFIRSDLDGDFLPGHEGRFDAIVAVEIIEHLENPRHFLRRAGELLATSGRLIVTTPNIASPVSKARFLATGRFQWFTEADRSSLGHLSPISPWLLVDALADAGFEQIALESFGDARTSLAGWWKLRALARFFSFLARSSGDPEGDLLIATARRAVRP